MTKSWKHKPQEPIDFYKTTHTWPRGLRARLIEREKGKCAICWSQQQLSIHHIQEHLIDRGLYRSDNYIDIPATKRTGKLIANFNLDGLLLLCGSCHGKIHTYKSNSPFTKLFVEIVESKRNGQSQSSDSIGNSEVK